MHIKKASIFDFVSIYNIYEKARKFMANNGNPNQWRDKYPLDIDVATDIANEKMYIVCDESEKICGVFFFDIMKDPTYEYIFDGEWLNDEEYGVIHKIAVDEDCHGRGVSALCFDFAASKCKNIRIDTHEDNKPMQRALQKYGFVRCGKIYVRGNEERIAFQKIVE